MGKNFFNDEEVKRVQRSAAAEMIENIPVKPVRTGVRDEVSPTPVASKQVDKTTSGQVDNDVMNDVMTLLLQDVDLKKWQSIIEDTETMNSALRITQKEREQIEDLLTELKRKHKIKDVSMNEMARLGLLFLIHDYKKNGINSILYKVKKA